MKICTKCKLEKSLTEFYIQKGRPQGVTSQCRSCKKEYSLKIQEPRKTYMSVYFQKNKEKLIKINKDWRARNPEQKSNIDRLWNLANKEKVNNYKKAWKKKKKGDPLYKLKTNISSLFRNSLKKRNFKKTSKTATILGCTFQELHNHLKNTFEENYGIPFGLIDTSILHIDHIIPVSSAKTEEELLKLNHYSNLQYLLAEDNLAKGNKLDWSLS